VDISIIIPTYNNAELLKNLLSSLSLQEKTAGIDYEILVVDNNSSDHSRSIVDAAMKDFSGRLRYFFEPRQGNAFARNTGIENARGEYICFTDDDCRAARDWIYQIRTAFTHSGALALQGRIELSTPLPEGALFSDEFIHARFAGVDYGAEGFIENRDLVGANAHFHRSIFEKFGEYSANKAFSVNQDTEFSRRIAKEGIKFYYAPQAVIYHHFDSARINEKFLFRQSFAWGRADVFLDDFHEPPLRHLIYCARLWLKSLVKLIRLKHAGKVMESILLRCKMRGYEGRMYQRLRNFLKLDNPESAQ
jgi:glycosyltransferase involved in cell wall biosynthesis